MSTRSISIRRPFAGGGQHHHAGHLYAGLLTNHDTGNGGTFGWSFLVADSAIDYLQAGQTVTQSYIVSVDDDHGGVAQKTVTITIHGTNDVPTILSAGNPTTQGRSYGVPRDCMY